MLEASQEGGVKKVTPERAAMERHTYLLPGQVAVFAQVVGDLIMTGGAEGRLLFASLIEVGAQLG